MSYVFVGRPKRTGARANPTQVATTMSAPQKKRSSHFSDWTVQGTVLLHVAMHWMIFLVAVGAFLLFLEAIDGEPSDAWENMLRRHGPSVLFVLVLSPIYIRELCKLTNRFAGPMVRVRRGMHELAEGRDVAPIHFRPGDFWQELATDFNLVAERLRNSSKPGSSRPAPDGEEEDSEHELVGEHVAV